MHPHTAITSRLNSLAGVTKTKVKNVMKTHNNTTMICLTMGMLTGSVLAGLMINQDWFVISVILAISLGIFYTTHGKEKIQQRSKNTFKS